MFALFSITQSELEHVREFCRAYLALKQMALNLGSRNGNGHLWTTNYGETLFQYIPKIITRMNLNRGVRTASKLLKSSP